MIKLDHAHKTNSKHVHHTLQKSKQTDNNSNRGGV